MGCERCGNAYSIYKGSKVEEVEEVEEEFEVYEVNFSASINSRPIALGSAAIAIPKGMDISELKIEWFLDDE